MGAHLEKELLKSGEKELPKFLRALEERMRDAEKKLFPEGVTEDMVLAEDFAEAQQRMRERRDTWRRACHLLSILESTASAAERLVTPRMEEKMLQAWNS